MHSHRPDWLSRGTPPPARIHMNITTGDFGIG